VTYVSDTTEKKNSVGRTWEIILFPKDTNFSKEKALFLVSLMYHCYNCLEKEEWIKIAANVSKVITYLFMISNGKTACWKINGFSNSQSQQLDHQL
jgi:hypothetical protein